MLSTATPVSKSGAYKGEQNIAGIAIPLSLRLNTVFAKIIRQNSALYSGSKPGSDRS